MQGTQIVCLSTTQFFGKRLCACVLYREMHSYCLKMHQNVRGRAPSGPAEEDHRGAAV